MLANRPESKDSAAQTNPNVSLLSIFLDCIFTWKIWSKDIYNNLYWCNIVPFTILTLSWPVVSCNIFSPFQSPTNNTTFKFAYTFNKLIVLFSYTHLISTPFYFFPGFNMPISFQLRFYFLLRVHVRVFFFFEWTGFQFIFFIIIEHINRTNKMYIARSNFKGTIVMAPLRFHTVVQQLYMNQSNWVMK